jgi:phosphoglycerol transferase MdoB-like AlkP superfamily enzyme
MNTFLKKYFYNSISICIFSSIIINFLIECFSRRSIVSGYKYLFDRPIVFFYNSLIILLTLSIIFLTKRRVFLYVVICTIWLGFGITNGIILSNRVTPFTAIDFTLIKSGLAIMNTYLSKLQITLIFIGLTIVAISFVMFWIFAPIHNKKINYKKNISSIGGFLFSFSLLTHICIDTKVVSTYFGNIAFAYIDYGFPYCFSNTLLNTGIDKPKNYSESTIKNIFVNNIIDGTIEKNITVLSGINNKTSPNIIMLQLESFFDPTLVKGITFSEDPVPNFRKLKNTFTSGFLNVPSIGAGTANTEFEILSGMSLDFFGPGEYPYKTILKEKTCESISYNLKDLGYSTHAIHNHQGTFYGRNFVFSQLGFDTFTSVEYMNVKERTPLNWAKDSILTEEIISTLNSTENKDFIYTISVQGHGDYPKYKLLDNPKITLTGIEDGEQYNAFEYYVNQINEMDAFIGELVATLSKIDEDTILVLYGDHLPSLGISNDMLKNNSLYQTEYVIWSNFGLPKESADLEAYQLTSSVLMKLGISNGTLIQYHQNYKNSCDYQENLELLQYDMLYGEQYIYDGINPFVATDLKMGVEDINILSVSTSDNQIYINGENFTESSRVTINENSVDTIFIDESTLKVPNTTINNLDSFKVNQVKGHTILSSTDEFIYNN